jgi:hypothetical protein
LFKQIWAIIMGQIDMSSLTTPLLITCKECVEKEGCMEGNKVENKKIKKRNNTINTGIQSFKHSSRLLRNPNGKT